MALLVAGVLLFGCGGSQADSAADRAILADRAERLADHLDAGDGCLAEREGEELASRARDALAAERIDAQVAGEIVAVVAEVTAQVPCDEAPAAETEPTEESEPAEETPEEDHEDDHEDEEPGEVEEEHVPPGRSEEGPPGRRGKEGADE